MRLVKDKNDWSNIRERIAISGDLSDERYKDYPFSNILSHYRIAHTGVLTTGDPYELTRVHQNGSCMIATLEGEGKVFVDGKWINLPKGHACLLPPFAYNSIKSVKGQSWTFTWVKYLEDEGSHPVVTALSPVFGTYDARAMQHAVSGLYQNMSTLKNKGTETLWVELIHKHVLVFSKPKVEDERLWQLWNEVQQDLTHPWTVQELAYKANVSTEHLRRLCKKQFGRSAKQQLEHLKMRQARILLSDQHIKVEAVAQRLGYGETASFSSAFKKYMGFSPSEMR